VLHGFKKIACSSCHWFSSLSAASVAVRVSRAGNAPGGAVFVLELPQPRIALTQERP
jgi:hypothetical protein